MLETNYCVTATELKALSQTRGFVAKEIVQNSDKGVIKTEGTENYYLSTSPLNPFATNQLPRYQDFQCPDPGVSLTFTGTSSFNDCTVGATEYVFQLSASSQGPSAPGFTMIFDVVLPAGITYKEFKYIKYNGATLNPTAPFYNVTNQDPQYFRVELFKQIGNGDDYTIAFNVNRTTLYGARTVETNLTSRFCNVSSTVPRTYTYTDPAPSISAVLAAPAVTVDCGKVIQYELSLSNSGSPTCDVVFESTLPSGVNLQSLEYNVNYDFYNWWCIWCSEFNTCDSCGTAAPASFFFWNTYPSPGWTSPVQVLRNGVLRTANLEDDYDVLEFNETTNKIKVRFKGVIGNGNTYTMYFYGDWLEPTSPQTVSSSGTVSYISTSSGGTTPVSTNTVSTTLTKLTPTTYYELSGCDGSSYAITLIQPLGVNNRYVDSQTGKIYLATGTTFTQCTVPGALNENIQRTASYNCSDPTTTTTTTFANINFDISYNCTSNGINNITISNFSGGTGSYQANINPQTSGANAQNSTFFQLTSSSHVYEFNSNGTWYVAVRDGNDTGRITIKNTGNIYCCPNTTPDWRNNGSYNCYGTCDQYYVEQDYNNCSNTYGQTRQGALRASNSTDCGGCCGQGPCCGQSTSQVASVNPIGTYHSCSNGTVNTTPVYQNTNTCYTGPNIYLFNGNWQSSNPSNSYPVVTANWTNSGVATCNGCTQEQPQTDINQCSSTYGQTRTVPTGNNTDCGTWTWVYYCVNYGVAPYEYRRYEQNSCTSATRNDELVEYNSPSCGYPYYTYNIIAYTGFVTVSGTYTDKFGNPSNFSFYNSSSSGGVVGSVCALQNTVTVTSGNGTRTQGSTC